MRVVKSVVLVLSCCIVFACANATQSNQNSSEPTGSKVETVKSENTVINDVGSEEKESIDVSASEDESPSSDLQNSGQKSVKSSNVKDGAIRQNENEVVAKPTSRKSQDSKNLSEVSSTSNTSPTTSRSEASSKEEKTGEVVASKKEERKQSRKLFKNKKKDEQSAPMHGDFNTLLQKHVSSNGGVDYAGIQSDSKLLEKYISELEKFPPQADWSTDTQLAYWINAYNAYTIKMIIDHYPVKSITDLYSGKPWDHQWIKIDGKTLSLNGIENDIIRPTFKEPRIHFAVNCAAKSCPPLKNEAYTAENLESLLASNTEAFINNPTYNDLAASPAKISKIFDWYAEDFGDVVTYINRYMNSKRPPIKKVVYAEYDWSLNSK